MSVWTVHSRRIYGNPCGRYECLAIVFRLLMWLLVLWLVNTRYLFIHEVFYPRWHYVCMCVTMLYCHPVILLLVISSTYNTNTLFLSTLDACTWMCVCYSLYKFDLVNWHTHSRYSMCTLSFCMLRCLYQQEITRMHLFIGQSVRWNCHINYSYNSLLYATCHIALYIIYYRENTEKYL